MDPVVFFVVITSIYGVLYFFDRFFKSCMHYPYDAFLRNTGFTVRFMSLHWRTTALNRWLLRWAAAGHSCLRDFLVKSFTLGVIFTFLLLPVGIILLIITIFGNTTTTTTTGSGKHIDSATAASTAAAAAATSSFGDATGALRMEILLPGVNLPLEEIGYYIATLIIATVLHELGHALAAAMEDVPVTGFGFKLYYCLPLAYTELSMDQLNTLKWFRKLRILCAGIWHNFLFSALCYILIATLSPTVSPFFTYNENVIVMQLTPKSPLRIKPTSNDQRGLQQDNVITHINECQVLNLDTWYACLTNALLNRPGYCISSDFIRLNDESIDISHHSVDGQLQCCDAHNLKLNCFEYTEDFSNDAPVEIPQHVCLDVRRTIEESFDYCSAAGTCTQGFCLRPLMRNSSTIITFKRQTMSQKPLRDVIYIGHPRDVSRTVRISPFVPKQRLISSFWPDAYALLLKYNVVFSFGLALVNAIPCFGFDGSHITTTIIHSFLVKRITDRGKRDFIAFSITGFGTLLFGLAMLRVFWLSAVRHLF